jgi:DNA-binding response OmpR family regulator
MTSDKRPRGRVLVADDNRDAAFALSMVLQIDGFEVKTAYDGLEALALAEIFKPQVYILDLNMPRLHGFGLAKRIRHEPWAAHAYLIAFTAFDDLGVRKLARVAGFDRFLVKPLDLPEFIEIIEDALRGMAPDSRPH